MRLLGFGQKGHDLAKSYQITLERWETVDGVKTAKLNLVAKSEKIQKAFSRFLLWMDPERDGAIKEQFFQPSGDYRLSHYTNIQLNKRIPEEALNIKAPGATVVKP